MSGGLLWLPGGWHQTPAPPAPAVTRLGGDVCEVFTQHIHRDRGLDGPFAQAVQALELRAHKEGSAGPVANQRMCWPQPRGGDFTEPLGSKQRGWQEGQGPGDCGTGVCGLAACIDLHHPSHDRRLPDTSPRKVLSPCRAIGIIGLKSSILGFSALAAC